MQDLLNNLPPNVRLVREPGTIIGIVGFPGPRKMTDDTKQKLQDLTPERVVETTTPARSMDEFFNNQPPNVRLSREPGTIIGIVGFRGSPK